MKIKITGTMINYFYSKKFATRKEAQEELSRMRKYLKNNKIGYNYLSNAWLTINEGKAEIWND